MNDCKTSSLKFRQPLVVCFSAIALLLMLGLTSCADRFNPARGYWIKVAGDAPPPSQDAVRIYDYDWYAIDVYIDGRAFVTWDDGLICTRSSGRMEDNEIRLTANDVTATFTFSDATHATATFQHGQDTYVKQLQKTRDNPRVQCL